MTGYTSGKTTHDPEPHAVYGVNGYSIGRVAEKGERTIYAPRPEYDNHNPILVAFREDDEKDILPWRDDLEENFGYAVMNAFGWTPEHIDHARRVLEKLAALA